MRKINTRRLRTLRGMVGRFQTEEATYGTRVHFVDRNGKMIMKDLRKWEVQQAKFYNHPKSKRGRR